ncbi:hypothetical protein SLOPH_1136 [Spraguea lophii 42_110]|uniref:Uncharacterized protein n=1 Tax=Spraguea lophii (strain 42_110) TaxID=1358809 RepID=S7W6P7_SPRLO|nr:hypothetical protein SLOPH_1136 [Spraguea lophii 42_110]
MPINNNAGNNSPLDRYYISDGEEDFFLSDKPLKYIDTESSDSISNGSEDTAELEYSYDEGNGEYTYDSIDETDMRISNYRNNYSDIIHRRFVTTENTSDNNDQNGIAGNSENRNFEVFLEKAEIVEEKLDEVNHDIGVTFDNLRSLKKRRRKLLKFKAEILNGNNDIDIDEIYYDSEDSISDEHYSESSIRFLNEDNNNNEDEYQSESDNDYEEEYYSESDNL